MSIWGIFILLFLASCGVSIFEVQLEQSSCLCPDRVEYQCHVYEAQSLVWHSNNDLFADIEYVSRDTVGKTIESVNLTVNLTGKIPNMLESINYTSTLRVHSYQLNETELTCIGLRLHGSGAVRDSHNDSINICITGVTSDPSNMSVEWNLTSAVATVQFRPPVYGAECVVEYIVKAEREEKQVMCTSTHTKHLEQTYTCMMPEHVMGYIFIAVAIIPGPGGVLYHANSSIKCFAQFPVNISVNDRVCALALYYNVTWDQSGNDRVKLSWIQLKSGNTTIEEVFTKEYHLLKLDHGVTGLVELTVEFLSDNCVKQSSVQFEAKRVIKDVKADPKNTTVTILGKDYNNSFFLTFMVTTYTSSKLVGNVSLAPEIVIPLGLECNTSYNFTITVSEAVSGTVIDEYCGKYVYVANTLCMDVPEIAVKSDIGDARKVPLITIIFSACGGVFLFAVVLVVMVTTAIATKKKEELQNFKVPGTIERLKTNRTIESKENFHSEEVLTDRAAADEFNIIPAPPLYEELNYLPSKASLKEQTVEAETHLYHVLETNHQESPQQSSVTIEPNFGEPIYSVVNKGKKKSESSTAATPEAQSELDTSSSAVASPHEQAAS